VKLHVVLGLVLTGLTVLFATAPAGAAACANEALRGQLSSEALPDCRAYEQVSPVDKNDGDVAYGPRGVNGEIFGPTVVAPDGNQVSFSSFYAFAGNEGAPFLNQYLGSRGPAGWSTQGISPAITAPAHNLDTHSEYYAFSDDLSHAVLLSWAQPGQFSAFLRSPDGALTKLADQEPGAFQPPKFNGASSDFSRVLLAVAGNKHGLYLWSNGALTQVNTPGSIAQAGGAANEEPGWGRAISADGSRVYWHRTAPAGLFLWDDGANSEIEVSECDTGKTGEAGPGGDCLAKGTASGGGQFWVASEDGSTALFTDRAELTDDAGPSATPDDLNLYAYHVIPDAAGHHLVNLAPIAEAGEEARVEAVIAASEDLSYIYFVAKSVLADNAGAAGQRAEEGERNLYVWHGGTTKFIGKLANGTREPGLATREGNNLLLNSTVPSKHSAYVQVSPDGRRLLFVSFGQPTGYDNYGTWVNPAGKRIPYYDTEVYRYDADSGDLACLSCNPNEPPTGEAALGHYAFGSPAAMRFFSMSQDGSRVFFETPDSLVAQDTNALEDVYEWEADGTGSCQSPSWAGGCLSLVSSGKSTDSSWYQGVSPGGNDALFVTREQLVGQDTDDLMDLYDARVDGGFASQIAPVSASPCGSVAGCRGASPGAPSHGAPGTAAFNGNEAPPRVAPTFSIQRISKGQRRRLAAGKRVALQVHVSAPGRLRATVQGRLGGHRARTLARGRQRASTAGTVGVRLRLSRAARRYLARHGELRVRLRVRFSGVRRERTRRLTLRRPESRPAGSHQGGRR
jgi:hypothetical protein